MFHLFYFQIPKLIDCREGLTMKGKFSFLFFKNLHFKIHKEDVAEIWPTCLGH